MSENISIQISGLLGPVLIVMSTTEWINFNIWRSVDPTVVYLNGLILLIGGLIISRYHNFWTADWTLLVTLSGWLILILGAYRMVFPSGKQITKRKMANVVLAMLFFTGAFLTLKAYFNL